MRGRQAKKSAQLALSDGAAGLPSPVAPQDILSTGRKTDEPGAGVRSRQRERSLAAGRRTWMDPRPP